MQLFYEVIKWLLDYAYSFFHSDGFTIKFHFLLLFCGWQERERERERERRKKGGLSRTIGDKSTQGRKSSIFTPSAEEKPGKKPKCPSALHINRPLVPVWHPVLNERSDKNKITQTINNIYLYALTIYVIEFYAILKILKWRNSYF